MGLSLAGPHPFAGQKRWPSAHCLVISEPAAPPLPAPLTGQLAEQSLGLAKVQSSFAAGEKNFLP